MPRTYKPVPNGKRYQKYDNATIKQALEEYACTSTSFSLIAKKYNIKKSVLHRHNKRKMKTQGGQKALDDNTEICITKYLNICSNWGYLIDLYDLRTIIKLHLDQLGITNRRFKNNMPGPDFTASFLKRHKNAISFNIHQNIKDLKATVTTDVIEKYFSHLKVSPNDIGPKNIMTYVEFNLSDEPGSKKVIAKRETKYPDENNTETKCGISVILTGTGAGDIMPPYVIYKANNIYESWRNNGPNGTYYNRTTSGWIDGGTFEDYIKTIVIPFFTNIPGKKKLIGDNLSSHLSVEVIRVIEENNISFIFLPSNSTHLTNALDIAFFRPMNCAWSNILLKWKETEGKVYSAVPKGCFPKLLKELFNTLSENTILHIKRGFHKAGIIPIDSNQIISKLFKNKKMNANVTKYAIDKPILNKLLKTRFEMSKNEKKFKRKQILRRKRKTVNNYFGSEFKGKIRKTYKESKNITAICVEAVDTEADNIENESVQINSASFDTLKVLKPNEQRTYQAKKFVREKDKTNNIGLLSKDLFQDNFNSVNSVSKPFLINDGACSSNAELIKKYIENDTGYELECISSNVESFPCDNILLVVIDE